jgi:macrolide-specific efflux system membrane fusion protein
MRNIVRNARLTAVAIGVMNAALVVVGFRSSQVLAATPGDLPTVARCLVSLIDESQVPAQEPGVIVQLNVREGSLVKKGDVLAQLDDAPPQIDRRKAMADQAAATEKAHNDIDVRYAKAAADVAYVEYEKSLDAAHRVPGSVVEVELNRLKLTYRRAELQIEQAQLEQRLAGFTVEEKAAEVSAADEAIRRRQIRAPLDGVVVQVIPHVGEWAKPGDTVCRLVRMDRLRVEGFFKSDQYAPQDLKGKPVIVSVDMPGSSQPLQFNGRIVFVSPLVEAGGEYRVWAEVDNRLVLGRNDEWLLHAGVNASMQINVN